MEGEGLRRRVDGLRSRCELRLPLGLRSPSRERGRPLSRSCSRGLSREPLEEELWLSREGEPRCDHRVPPGLRDLFGPPRCGDRDPRRCEDCPPRCGERMRLSLLNVRLGLRSGVLVPALRWANLQLLPARHLFCW